MAISRRLIRGAILIVALGFSAVLALGMWMGSTQREERVVGGDAPSEAEMRLTDMEYTELQGGKRLWTIRATEAKYFQEEQKTLLTAVQLTFFLEDGQEILLEGQGGVLYAGTKNIELWNAIRAKLPQGYELSTERVFYDHKQQTITSDTLIRLVGPEVDLQGSRWQYSIPERRALLEGGVQATVVSLAPQDQTNSARPQ